MEILGAALGRIFHRAAAGVAELRRIGGFDDAHLADALDRRRALVTVLVPRSVAECHAVEEVLRSEGLAAVDPRSELAAAEHGVAIGAHRGESRLELQERLGKTDVGAHHHGQVAVVAFADGVRHVRLVGIHHVRSGRNFDLVGYRAEFQAQIDAISLAAHHFEVRANARFESRVLDRNAVDSEHQQRRRIGARVVGGQHRFDAGVLVADMNAGAGDVVPRGITDDPGNRGSIRALSER